MNGYTCTDVIHHYVNSGISVIPINTKTKRPASWLLPQDLDLEGNPLWWNKKPDGSGSMISTQKSDSPARTWKPFQIERPDAETVYYWATRNINAMAAVCGGVSNGLEIIDFDVPGYFEQWQVLIDEDVQKKLVIQQTGSGNYQAAYRCLDIEGNQKLAWHPDDSSMSGRTVAIETRGEGGYAVIPPSVHPSGGIYSLVQGRFSQLNELTPEERQHIHQIARSLCNAPLTKQQIAKKEKLKDLPIDRRIRSEQERQESENLIAWYNEQNPIETVLQRYGYTRVTDHIWSRPGKADSAGVRIIAGTNKTFNFSSNDALIYDRDGEQQPADAFDYFAYLECNEDYAEAMRRAGKEMRSNPVTETAYFEQKPTTVKERDSHAPSFTVADEYINHQEYMIIALTQGDFSAFGKMEFPACYHPDNATAWQNGTRNAISHVRDIFLLAGEKTRSEAQKIASGIRRASIVNLPAGFDDVAQFVELTAYPERWVNDAVKG